MLTRREFVAKLAIAGTFAVMPAAVRPATLAAHTPVVSIHMEQPYTDSTGLALPYLPPVGLRAGAPVAHLTETQFRTSFVYL
jgi:hypothetical protein